MSAEDFDEEDRLTGFIERDPNAPEYGESGGAEAFPFGQEPARPLPSLVALERMSERIGRLVRQRIEPLSRLKTHVYAEAVTVEEFDEWKAGQEEFLSVSLYRFAPLKGGILIAIPAELVGRLVDACYGGPGSYGERRVKEFTPTEERLLARLSEAVIEALTEVWSEVFPVHAQLNSRETSTAYLGLGGSDERTALSRLQITIGEQQPCSIDILYPIASLHSVESQLSSSNQDDNANSPEWRSKLHAAVGNVRLHARSVLARPTLSVSQFLQLQPGDVIPISMPKMVPLIVAGRQIALGTIGEQEGHVAIKIERMETGSLH